MAPRSTVTPYSCQVLKRTLYVYAEDHGPPHAHVRMNKDSGGWIRCLLTDGRRWPGDVVNRDALRDWPTVQRALRPMLPVLRENFDRLNPNLHGA